MDEPTQKNSQIVERFAILRHLPFKRPLTQTGDQARLSELLETPEAKKTIDVSPKGAGRWRFMRWRSEGMAARGWML